MITSISDVPASLQNIITRFCNSFITRIKKSQLSGVSELYFDFRLDCRLGVKDGKVTIYATIVSDGTTDFCVPLSFCVKENYRDGDPVYVMLTSDEFVVKLDRQALEQGSTADTLRAYDEYIDNSKDEYAGCGMRVFSNVFPYIGIKFILDHSNSVSTKSPLKSVTVEIGRNIDSKMWAFSTKPAEIPVFYTKDRFTGEGQSTASVALSHAFADGVVRAAFKYADLALRKAMEKR